MKRSYSKKFWEELTAYFTSITHGPHRKRRVQQFYNCCVCVAAVTLLRSRCLATIGGTHRLEGTFEISH